MMKKLFIFIFAIIVFQPDSMALAEEKVGALGYIRPDGGILKILGPSGDIIADIKVKEGDFVEQGTPLVILSSKGTHESEVARAELSFERADKLGEKAIALQELKVNEVLKRSAKAITIQEIKINKAEENYGLALRKFKNIESIGEDSFSIQAKETRKCELKMAQIDLDMVKQELERVKLDRDLNLETSKQELERLKLDRGMNVRRANQDLETAKEKLNSSVIRAPINGTILEIHQNVGESTGGMPILSMADLRQMYVVAEIFEADLLKLFPGMKATVSSKSLPNPLTGQVEKVGRVLSEVAKVADVKIRLENSEVASKLINLEVNVSIQLGNTPSR